MARVYRRYQPDESVQVELKSGKLLFGAVIWVRTNEIGVQFSSPVDVADALSVQWDGRTQTRPRLPRLNLTCSATIRRGAKSLPALVLDISHRGAKIRSNLPVVAAAQIVLTLPGLRSIDGVVRWTREEEAGLLFNECLPFDVLARSLIERRHSESIVTPERASAEAGSQTPFERVA